MYGPGGEYQGPSGDSRGSRERSSRNDAPSRARRERASQRIVDRLRQRIRDGELTPGDRLPPERELCERYGVSRVTVREALRVLEASGLVDIRLGSHGGAFVTTPTAERVTGGVEDYLTLSGIPPAMIREARLLLELGLVRLACERASDEDLQQLNTTYEEFEAAWEDGRYERSLARDFQMRLALAARNDAIDVLLRPLYGPALSALENAVEVRPGGEPPEGELPVQEYRRLLEAVRARDGEGAAAILRARVTSRNEPE